MSSVEDVLQTWEDMPMGEQAELMAELMLKVFLPGADDAVDELLSRIEVWVPDFTEARQFHVIRALIQRANLSRRSYLFRKLSTNAHTPDVLIRWLAYNAPSALLDPDTGRFKKLPQDLQDHLLRNHDPYDEEIALCVLRAYDTMRSESFWDYVWALCGRLLQSSDTVKASAFRDLLKFAAMVATDADGIMTLWSFPWVREHIVARKDLPERAYEFMVSQLLDPEFRKDPDNRARYHQFARDGHMAPEILWFLFNDSDVWPNLAARIDLPREIVEVLFERGNDVVKTYLIRNQDLPPDLWNAEVMKALQTRWPAFVFDYTNLKSNVPNLAMNPAISMETLSALWAKIEWPDVDQLVWFYLSPAATATYRFGILKYAIARKNRIVELVVRLAQERVRFTQDELKLILACQEEMNVYALKCHLVDQDIPDVLLEEWAKGNDSLAKQATDALRKRREEPHEQPEPVASAGS